jgi:hypothetical protein
VERPTAAETLWIKLKQHFYKNNPSYILWQTTMNLYQLLKPVSELWIKFRLTGDWRGVRFLCYHSVIDDRRTMHPVVKDLSVTTKEFKDHLAYFHRAGLPVIG